MVFMPPILLSLLLMKRPISKNRPMGISQVMMKLKKGEAGSMMGE